MAPQRHDEPVTLVFMDDTVVAEGVPANFKGVIPTCQIAPMVRYFEPTGARRRFRHCRLSQLGDAPGYLVVGLFGGPLAWLGEQGHGPAALADRIPDLRPILDAHRGLHVLLDYSWEAGFGDRFLGLVDAFVARLGVDPARVVLLVSNTGTADRHHRHLLAHDRPAAAAIRVVALDLFLAYSAVEFMSKRGHGPADALVSLAEVERLAGTVRPRKFRSLNRRPRWHRYILAMMLGALGARDQGFLSMASPSYEGDWVSEDRLVERFGSRMDAAVWQRLLAAQQETLASLPWILDVNVDRSGHTSDYAYRNMNRDAFAESYVQIVTESYMEGDQGDVFVTEKTCKALANLQPFLVFGNAGTLARLEQLGFAPPQALATGYDSEHDTGRRLTALFHAVAELAAMPPAELHARYHDGLAATAHNRDRLFEMPELLGRQLAGRLAAALAEQPRGGAAPTARPAASGPDRSLEGAELKVGPYLVALRDQGALQPAFMLAAAREVVRPEPFFAANAAGPALPAEAAFRDPAERSYRTPDCFVARLDNAAVIGADGLVVHGGVILGDTFRHLTAGPEAPAVAQLGPDRLLLQPGAGTVRRLAGNWTPRKTSSGFRLEMIR